MNDKLKEQAIEFVGKNWKSEAITFPEGGWKEEAVTFVETASGPDVPTCKETQNQSIDLIVPSTGIKQEPDKREMKSEKEFAVAFPVGSMEAWIQDLYAFAEKHNIPKERCEEAVAKTLSISLDTNTIIESETYYYESGFLYYKENGTTPEKVANFEVVIEKEIKKIEREDEDGVANSRYYYLGKIIRKDCLHDFEIACEDILQFKWLKRASKGKCFIYNRSLFEGYIETLTQQELEKTTIYLTNGWKNFMPSKWGYVIDRGIIGYPDLKIYGNSKQRFFTDVHLNDKKRNFELFLKMSEITKNPEKIVPLMLFTCIGTLTKLYALADFPVKFSLGYFGVTNSKKTSISVAVTKIFNRNNLDTPEVSFYSTEGGIEVAMSTFSDAVLLIDDKRPCESRSERLLQNKKYEAILRSYGDRTSKKRMTAFANTSVFYPPSGVCLITGEVDSGVASTKTRIVIIETDCEQCNNEKLLFFQENKFILTNFIHNFIEYITSDFSGVVEDIKRNCRDVRDQYSSSFNVARYAEYYAIFHEILRILKSYGNYVGLRSDFMSEYDKIVFNLLKSNDNSINDHNPGLMFLEAINNICNLEPEKLRNVESGKKLNNVKSTDIFVGNDEIFLKLDYAYSITLKYWKSFGIEFTLENSKQIIPFLKSMNVIKTENSRNTIKRTAYVDSQERFLVLKKTEFEKIMRN